MLGQLFDFLGSFVIYSHPLLQVLAWTQSASSAFLCEFAAENELQLQKAAGRSLSKMAIRMVIDSCLRRVSRNSSSTVRVVFEMLLLHAEDNIPQTVLALEGFLFVS